MIKLQTTIEIEDIETPISYQHKIMAIGSCFVENIGQRLNALKYNIAINPFGIQYNPQSISTGLSRLLEGNAYQASDLFQHNGLWHSFAHHGSFSAIDKEETLSSINQRLAEASQHLKETDILVVTLGTAWVYSLKADGHSVNNCHKMPAAHFSRHRLSVTDVVLALEQPLQLIFERFPKMSVLLTVSPIRHLKDGAVENQLSKATLLLAAETLGRQFAQISYFPAYELMMDELRDYRFYARDLTHPNDLAIDYIWERFERHCLASADKTLRIRIEKIISAIQHRPLHPNSVAYKAFLEKQLTELQTVEKQHTYLNFNTEMRYLLREIEGINI